MTCTRCGSHNCSRSHRRGAEYILSALGVFPWRCRECRARFYARRIPLRQLPYARCPRCANLELMRIRLDRVRPDFVLRLAVCFGAKPVRCDPCRLNFASWRLLRPAEEEPVDVELEQDVQEVPK